MVPRTRASLRHDIHSGSERQAVEQRRVEWVVLLPGQGVWAAPAWRGPGARRSLPLQTGDLLSAFVQLCHISTTLAEKTWVQLFPRLWKILSDRQQHVSLCFI